MGMHLDSRSFDAVKGECIADLSRKEKQEAV